MSNIKIKSQKTTEVSIYETKRVKIAIGRNVFNIDVYFIDGKIDSWFVTSKTLQNKFRTLEREGSVNVEEITEALNKALIAKELYVKGKH